MSVEHFFIVGAQRSGTTYLYQILAAHPEIEMAQPLRPEPKFFLRDDLAAYKPSDYQTLFFQESSPQIRLRGEKSTTYIESEQAARQIAAWYPQAKLIFLLRDPIQRAVSNYRFSRQNGLETLPMQAAFFEEDQRYKNGRELGLSTSPYAYLHRGLYLNYIQMYERYFPKENLIILISEELIGQLELIQALYGRLGVQPDYAPPHLNETFNESNATEENLAPDLADYMRDYFAEANQKLAAYLGRPIPSWSGQISPQIKEE